MDLVWLTMALAMLLDMELAMELLSHLLEMDSSMAMGMGMAMDTLETRGETCWGYLSINVCSLVFYLFARAVYPSVLVYLASLVWIMI